MRAASRLNKKNLKKASQANSVKSSSGSSRSGRSSSGSSRSSSRSSSSGGRVGDKRSYDHTLASNTWGVVDSTQRNLDLMVETQFQHHQKVLSNNEEVIALSKEQLDLLRQVRQGTGSLDNTLETKFSLAAQQQAEALAVSQKIETILAEMQRKTEAAKVAETFQNEQQQIYMATLMKEHMSTQASAIQSHTESLQSKHIKILEAQLNDRDSRIAAQSSHIYNLEGMQQGWCKQKEEERNFMINRFMESKGCVSRSTPSQSQQFNTADPQTFMSNTHPPYVPSFQSLQPSTNQTLPHTQPQSTQPPPSKLSTLGYI